MKLRAADKTGSVIVYRPNMCFTAELQSVADGR